MDLNDEGLRLAALALLNNRDNPEFFDAFPSQEVHDAAVDLATVAITAYLRAVLESDELVRLRSIRHGVQGGLSDAEDPLTALLPSGELPLTDPVGQDAPVLVGELDGSDSDSHVFTMTRSGPKRRTPPRFYQHRFDAHLVCELCGVTRAECDDAEFYPICIPIPLVEARILMPSIQDMIADLDKALHGRTWARPQTPKQVWEGLLDEVARLSPDEAAGGE